MRIWFLGAAQEVTGSMYLLELAQGTLLIDCGFFQGRREDSRKRNSHLPSNIMSADAVILTHAHIDHSGSIPTLVKAGYTGPIYSTPATRDLCAYMLRDAARIQESDANYLNRKYADDPDFDPIDPIYDEEDVVSALGLFTSVPYHRPFQPLPDVSARFFNSGHILGSALLVLDIVEHGERRRIVFSGDLGRKGLPIIRDPEYPPTPVDYVVMESTYGNRVHPSVEKMHDNLARVITDTVRRNGKVIVPAFAVGRTQELLYALNELTKEKRIPPIPVFIDSPLAISVTEVFKLHPECFDTETRAFLEAHGEVFGFPNAHFVSSREESLKLNDLKDPAIIISASGMAEAGRILHHLRNNIEDDRNTILIVGFMAQHTLGRRLMERRSQVKIWGVPRDLHAHVEVLSEFSAHADRNDLLKFAKACGPQTRKVFLVHGEPEAQAPLREAITSLGQDVYIPSRGEAVVLS